MSPAITLNQGFPGSPHLDTPECVIVKAEREAEEEEKQEMLEVPTEEDAHIHTSHPNVHHLTLTEATLSSLLRTLLTHHSLTTSGDGDCSFSLMRPLQHAPCSHTTH